MSENKNQWEELFEIFNRPRKPNKIMSERFSKEWCDAFKQHLKDLDEKGIIPSINEASKFTEQYNKMSEKEFTEQDMIDFGLLVNRFIENREPNLISEDYVKNVLKNHFKKLREEQQKQYPEELRKSILSFKDQFGYMYPRDQATYCFNSNTLEGLIKKTDFKIWSVQNGEEVLTVGDKTNKGIIKSFFINDENKLSFATEPIKNHTGSKYEVYDIYSLPDNLIKKLTPLFQIAGKDIFENDSFYRVHLGAAKFNNVWVSEYCSATHNSYFHDGVYKYFLTEAEANAYITENKPAYSLKQMRECFEESRLTHPMIGWKHRTFEDFCTWLK